MQDSQQLSSKGSNRMSNPNQVASPSGALHQNPLASALFKSKMHVTDTAKNTNEAKSDTATAEEKSQAFR